jgi:alkylhydroperoxidase/carboxymuconolactone decarboxylase family protein YurZ
MSRKSLLPLLFVASFVSVCALYAQEGLQQQVGQLKESMAKNKQALAQYTWVETVTISLKGEEKKQQHYQVQIGPDGKPQKTSLDSAPAAQPQSSGRGGRVKQRVIEKKKEEYEDYAEQMKALAQQYVPPDKDLIQAAYAKGNISMEPGPGGVKLVIHNYVKPGDSMTLTIDKEQKQLQSIQIASYMDGPSDGMNLTVRFDRLPDGTNHVSSTTVEGVSKQLTVATQNGNYQKR